jgi:hypothetical protein
MFMSNVRGVGDLEDACGFVVHSSYPYSAGATDDTAPRDVVQPQFPFCREANRHGVIGSSGPDS